MPTLSPRSLLAGAVAGAVGTLAMDLVWYRRYRDDGGEDGFADWEFGSGAETFADAGAPAQVGQRVTSAVGIELDDDQAATTTNVVHWLTGVSYGLDHGVLNDRRGVVTGGVLTGVGAWLASYGVLGSVGIYDPIWEYDRETLVRDLTAHLVFGLATSATYRALTGEPRED